MTVKKYQDYRKKVGMYLMEKKPKKESELKWKVKVWGFLAKGWICQGMEQFQHELLIKRYKLKRKIWEERFNKHHKIGKYKKINFRQNVGEN